VEASGQLHAPAALPPGKGAPGTHWIGGWVNPRVGLDDEEKTLDPTGTRTPTPRSPNRNFDPASSNYEAGLLTISPHGLLLPVGLFVHTFRRISMKFEIGDMTEKLLSEFHIGTYRTIILHYTILQPTNSMKHSPS
jgi:hypothetical protein